MSFEARGYLGTSLGTHLDIRNVLEYRWIFSLAFHLPFTLIKSSFNKNDRETIMIVPLIYESCKIQTF